MPIELRVSADLHTLADLAAQYPRLGRDLADTVSRLHVFLPGGSLTTFEDFDGPLTAAGATHISAGVTDRYWREQTWRLPAEAILLTVTRLEPAP